MRKVTKLHDISRRVTGATPLHLTSPLLSARGVPLVEAMGFRLFT